MTPTGPSPATRNVAATPDSIIPCNGTFTEERNFSTAKAEAVLHATTIRSTPFASRKVMISRLYPKTVSADLFP